MCAVSMIYDYYSNKWDEKWPKNSEGFRAVPDPDEIMINVEDIQKLAKIAKDYDIRTFQEDCESEKKKEKLENLASELGIKLDI